MNNNFTVWIDVDDTILNLNERIISYFNNELFEDIKDKFPNGIKKEDLTEFNLTKFSPKIIDLFHDKELYLSENYEMTIVDHSFDLLSLLYIQQRQIGFDIKFITHSFNDEVAKNKELLLEKIFGIDKEDVIHTKDKFLYVKENDIFIDDAIHNHTQINEVTKNVIHYIVEQPWNHDLPYAFRGSMLSICNDLRNYFYNKFCN